MRRAPSIRRAVLRAQAVSLFAALLAVVFVGSIAALAVVVGRDDASAIALAHTLGSEIESHKDDSRARLDAVVRDELEEQRWFARHVEVHRRGEWLGRTAGGAPRFASAPAGDGCKFAGLASGYERVCAVHPDSETTIVVATPVGPILGAVTPLVLTVGASALLSMVIFVLVAGRLTRRSLETLTDLEQRIHALPIVARGMRIPRQWEVAEVDALAAAFDDLLARVDEAGTREHRFVANAAHELRSPLTRLRGQIDLALDEMGAEDDETHARLTAASRACAELCRTLDSLLALAQQELPATEPVDLVEAALGCREKLDDESARRVSVSGVDESTVDADPVLVALAVGNLVDNALKYTSGAVRVLVERDGDALVMRVEDDGPGIAAADRERMREPFVRGATASKVARGTGLGLSLADHVAKLHGGALALAPTEAGGLCASLRVSAR